MSLVANTDLPESLLTPSLSELCELVGLRSLASALLVSAIVNVAECQALQPKKAVVEGAQKLGSKGLLYRD
jgi:hypothetical protein